MFRNHEKKSGKLFRLCKKIQFGNLDSLGGEDTCAKVGVDSGAGGVLGACSLVSTGALALARSKAVISLEAGELEVDSLPFPTLNHQPQSE